MTTTPHSFAVLEGHQYANLTTYRRSGAGVVTPVWFAQVGDRIYVLTIADAGKVKRLRNNPAALLAPCTGSGKPLGGEVAMRGRVLPPAEEQLAITALDRKYGWQKKIFDLLGRLRGGKARRAYLEFTPAL